MAQFNADILLAVRGSEKAKREIEKLEASLDKLGQKANLDLGGQIRLKGSQSVLRNRIRDQVAWNKEQAQSVQLMRELNQLERVRGNANQYRGPIGPGQASPSQLSSSLAMRRNQLTQRGLNQYPTTIGPQPDFLARNKAIQKNLQLTRKIADITAKIDAQRSRRLKGQNSLTNGLLKLNKATLEAARSEAKERGESVAKQRELNNELKKTQQYSKAIGPKQAPGSRGGARRGGGGAGGGLAAGIGFPLLFGSGPGSVLGGALGSAGGFGTQILASAIGGIVDQAVAGVAKLGQALNPLTADIDAVVAAAGESGTAFEQLVKDLEKVAGKEKALAAATAQLAVVIGQDGVSALKEFGDESAELGRVFAQTLSQISAAVAELINNSGLLTAVAQRVGRTNLINSGLRNDTRDPELTDLGQELARANRGQGERSISVIEEEIVARQRLLQTEKQINIAKQAQADIQAKVNEKTVSSIALKEQELIIAQNGGDVLNEQVQTALQNIDAEKIRLKILEAQGDQLKLNLAFAEAELLAALRDARIAAAADAAARKAAAEAARLAREAEQARKKELQTLQTISQLDLKAYDIAIQTIRATEGESAAIKEQLSNMDALLAKRIEVINLSDKDQKIKDIEVALAEKQIALEQITLRNKQQEIALQRELNKLKAEQQVDAIQTGLDQELAGLALGGNDQTDLLQQQANRYENTLKDINNQIAQQNLLIENTPTPNQEAINAATAQLDTLEKTKSAYEAMLPQIFAAEQAQLKYNQAFAAVTPAVNALVGGLREVVAGTKTAEEAFADFLDTVADQLINTAATMIAQYLAIAAAKALAGLGPTPSIGGGVGGGAGGSIGFADGGFVTSPTKATVGEGGQPEYVIPENKMGSAMGRYNAGARGDAVVGGANAAESSDSPPAEQPSQINISGGVMQVDNTNYIRQDQIPSIVAQASKQGEARALRRLQMSPTARRKVGV